MTIEEIKQRLEAKHADDFRVARDASRNLTRNELETYLAKLEKLLPRFGETQILSGLDDLIEYEPYTQVVHLVEVPPENEVKEVCGECVWRDEYRRDWWCYQDGVYFSRVDLVTCIRALRDELTDRLSREFTHEQVGYDS